MYALVHKGKVISGPRDWNKAFFEFLLKRKKIDFGLIPRNPTAELPFIINSDTKIYPVEIVKENHDALIEYHRGPLWQINENVAIATYEVVEIELEFAKGNFKQLLSGERYMKEIAGTTATVQNTEVKIDTSRDGRNAFIQKYISLGNDDVANWKFAEGWLTLTKEELGVIITAINNHIQGTFDWEKEISDQIDSEISVNDLVKYKEIIKPNQNLGVN
jgi:hypothetical protein